MQTFLKNNAWSILALLVACGFTYGVLTENLAVVRNAVAKNELAVEVAVRDSRMRDEKIQDQYVALLTRYESSVGRMTAEIQGLKEQVARLAGPSYQTPKGGQ